MTTVMAVFAGVGAGNIGLENFLYDKADFKRYILTLNNSQKEAESFLAETYPKTAVQVVSGRGDKLGRLVGGLKAVFRSKPDVIHAHHTSAALVASIAKLCMRLKFVTTVHNDFAHYSRSQKLVFGFACLLSDRVVCNSANTLESLPRNVRRTKCSVIYNGVDFSKLDEILFQHDGAEAGGPFVVGTVCRMVPQKDLTILLDGFARFAQQSNQSVKLMLVGDGPERSALEKRVNALDIAHWVEFVGQVPRQKAYELLCCMDVFVVSSRWEGFCNAMVEAAAAGKAIVATNVDPLPEVVGRENAAFFEVGNVAELVVQLDTLSGNKEQRVGLGDCAHQYVRERYSLTDSAAEYKQLYAHI